MRFIVCLILVSFFVTVAHGQTVVVEDTNLTFNNLEGTICQDLACDPTSVFFQYFGGLGEIEAVEWNIDEESDWYVVEPGEVFGSASIAANAHPIIFTTDNPRGPVPVGGTDFYLGVSTGVGFAPTLDPFAPGPPNRDVFGWIRLRDNGGALEFVSSAVAYGAEGIIVGTTTAIPEPATGAGIVLLAMLGAVSRTRKI